MNNGLKRLVFAAAIVVSTLLATAPSAVAQTGYISGTVTDATTGKPLAGIVVDVYSSRQGILALSLCTASDGTYGNALPPGTWYVGFSTAFCGATDYIPQYYNDKSSLQSADPVLVSDGVTTSGIDAAMQPGNAIAGTVTDASTHAPIEGVEVDIYNSKQKFVASTCTGGADGSYHVWVTFGTYEVGFGTRVTGHCGSTPGYLPQFYNSKPSLATANPVSVTNGLPALAVAALQSAGAPTVTSVSPKSGPTAGGNTVTIRGTNFLAGASVKFGSAIATVTLVSATQLKVKAPAHAAKIVNVRVTTPKGTSAASAADHYRYRAP